MEGVPTQLLSQNEGGKFLADNGMDSKEDDFSKSDLIIVVVLTSVIRLTESF